MNKDLIIQKQDEIIRLLLAKVSKGESLDVTELLEFHKLTKELDSLKSAKDNPDRSAEPVNYFEIQEYTSDDYMKLEKETLVKLLMNCQKLLYGNQYAISNNHVEFSSSNQPVQSVKGEGERTAEDIKTLASKFVRKYLKGRPDDPTKHLHKLFVEALESYKHSESKEQWISVKDKTPEKLEPVIILTSYGKMATAYCVEREHQDYGWLDWMRSQHSYGSVTHWMPLPEPPKS